MRSSKNIYYLLPVVLLIWIVIAYKVINYMKPKDTALIGGKTIKKTSLNTKTDTFVLKLNYRDPFLEYAIHSDVSKRSSVKAPTKISPTMPVQFPEIKYHGIVTNRNTNKTIAIITPIGINLSRS